MINTRDNWDMDVYGLYGGTRRDSYPFVEPHYKRTKADYPYSYDPYFLWGRKPDTEGANADYHDRLMQWDHDKYDTLFKKHLMPGGYVRASQEKLSEFMSEYHGKKLEVVALAEGANQANGYPYWIIWWKKKT